MRTTTTDRVAKVITKIFNNDEDACDMRNCDKIGWSSIEDLFTYSNKAQWFLIFVTFQLYFMLTQFLKL